MYVLLRLAGFTLGLALVAGATLLVNTIGGQPWLSDRVHDLRWLFQQIKVNLP